MTTPIYPVEERYKRDPVFFALVNAMELQLAAYQFTPTELREAVILACTRHMARVGRMEPIGKEAADGEA